MATAPGRPKVAHSRSDSSGASTTDVARLRLDFVKPALSEGGRPSSSVTSVEEMAWIQQSVSADLHQLFLRWAADEATSVFIKDLIAAAKATPSATHLDYRPIYARACETVAPSGALAASQSLPSSARHAGLMLSPRGARSPAPNMYTGMIPSPVSTSSSASPSSTGRMRSTPPMSPTASLSLSGGFRVPPNSPGRSGRSPPASPRHFTCTFPHACRARARGYVCVCVCAFTFVNLTVQLVVRLLKRVQRRLQMTPSLF